MASVAGTSTGGGRRSRRGLLLAGSGVVALALAGTIVKIGWFSGPASSGSAASGIGAAGAGAGTSGGPTGSGPTGSSGSGSGGSGSSGSGSGGGAAPSAATVAASTGASVGGVGDGPGGVIAAVGLVQADEAVLTSTAPTVSVALVNTLATYAGGINARDLAAAYAAYSPAQQVKSPFAKWSKGVQGSRLSAVRILSATGAVKVLGSGPVVVDVTFTSRQPGSAGPVPGQTCTVWSLEYTMTPNSDGTGYLIDSARPSSGTGHTAC